MNLRIAAIVVSVNLLFLVAALAFFLRISFKRLYPSTIARKWTAFFTLAVVTVTGILGAWFYGLVGFIHSSELPTLTTRVEFPFGSFGGYWGVILGSILASFLCRVPQLSQADALVPGILVGGAVARLPGLFNEANPGITLHSEAFPWFQPFKYWAMYDIAIHLVVLLLVWQCSRRANSVPGLALAIFLVGYGLLRFCLEFVRIAQQVFGPFTYGHLMAAAQIVGGLILAMWLLRARETDLPLASTGGR